MRHQKDGRKFNRTASHRKAMFRNMVTSFFEHEKIQTTDTKAKELRRIAERLITLGKRGDLHARRQVEAVVRKKPITKKLFEEIAPRFVSREGGYTRITKVGRRRGDAAPLSIIELVSTDEGKKKEKKDKTDKTEGK